MFWAYKIVSISNPELLFCTTTLSSHSHFLLADHLNTLTTSSFRSDFRLAAFSLQPHFPLRLCTDNQEAVGEAEDDLPGGADLRGQDTYLEAPRQHRVPWYVRQVAGAV